MVVCWTAGSSVSRWPVMDVHPVPKHDAMVIAIVTAAVAEEAIVVVVVDPVIENVVVLAVVPVDDGRFHDLVPVRRVNPPEDVRPVRSTKRRPSVAVAARDEASAVVHTVAVTAETRC